MVWALAHFRSVLCLLLFLPLAVDAKMAHRLFVHRVAASRSAEAHVVRQHLNNSCAMCSCFGLSSTRSSRVGRLHRRSTQQQSRRLQSPCIRHAEGNQLVDTATILEELRSVLLPLNSRKAAGKMPGLDACRGFTLGLALGYGRGLVVPTAATRDWPELATVLCEACREENPDFKFTSIQVNRNTRYGMHSDGIDAGASRMICCGDFQRGRLWLHSSASGSWNATDCHDRWLAFDGREFDLTEDWDGPERFSLVYFTNQVFRRADGSKKGRATRGQLEQLGFPWPSQDDLFAERLPPEKDRRLAAAEALPDGLREEALLSAASYAGPSTAS